MEKELYHEITCANIITDKIKLSLITEYTEGNSFEII